MKKKFISLMLCVFCMLSFIGCGQTANDAAAPTAEPQATETVQETAAAQETPATEEETAEEYLPSISGTYVELFPELSKAEYRDIWIEATTPLVGAENAGAATDMLLAMCMAEPYGAEAAEKYTADPDSMAFNCYFLGGVEKFVMDGYTITGLDEQGQEVFSHSYKPMNIENENGFIFYESEDENSGEFTYFAFSPDTMESTYHLEFRYAEDVNDLQSWFEGNYAYWNAAGIAEDYDLETMKNVIELFATENLSSAE